MRVLIIFFSLFILSSCAKDIETEDCQKLEKALINNKEEEVKATLKKILGQSPIKYYTRTNLERVAELLSSQCDVEARLLCFSCIETLPEQSEMELKVSSVRRIIDISYSSANEIEFVGMHE